uniref:(northern house mosquito) hypothetical protein n=1 Tax=Culex pipiens TaxID=7175 RepID=A0A8D8CDI0_CULPI
MRRSLRWLPGSEPVDLTAARNRSCDEQESSPIRRRFARWYWSTTGRTFHRTVQHVQLDVTSGLRHRSTAHPGRGCEALSLSSAVNDLCYGDRRDQQRNWYSLRRRFVAVSTTHCEAQDNYRAGRSTHRDRRAHET